MTNSLYLICYFLALSTTLTTAAVVRDVVVRHNDTVTLSTVPDRKAFDRNWQSNNLRLSQDYYQNAAKEHFSGFYKINNEIFKRSWQINGLDGLHAGMQNNL